MHSEIMCLSWKLTFGGNVCSEAHCLSQWSFNFRPSFLRIKKELEFIQPQAVLALTATAPRHVQQDVMHHLSIDKEGNDGIAIS